MNIKKLFIFILFILFSCDDSCYNKFNDYYCSYRDLMPGTNIPFPIITNYDQQEWDILIDIANNFYDSTYCDGSRIITNPNIIGELGWLDNHLNKLKIYPNIQLGIADQGTFLSTDCDILYEWKLDNNIINLIQSFKNLDTLDLSHDQIISIPSNICSLPDSIFIIINDSCILNYSCIDSIYGNDLTICP